MDLKNNDSFLDDRKLRIGLTEKAPKGSGAFFVIHTTNLCRELFMLYIAKNAFWE
jgi:hypothetical protein